MQKKFMATAAASTLGGAVVGATLLAPTLAGAQDDGDDGATTEAETAPAEAGTDIEPGVRLEPGIRIEEALQGLVDDGTLTEAQVDAVAEALVEARGEVAGRFRGHHGHRGGPFAGADIAETLGLEQDELREALGSGQSLAEIAEAQGVDPQTLVDAIVAATEERVNGAVENGRIDQDRADEILANAAERADDAINGEFEFGPRRGGPGPDAAEAEGTPDTDDA